MATPSCGPNCPQLTLVDLPGLIHSENEPQSSDDVILVSEQVERYKSEPRTIILPIISAKNDYANQIILRHVRSVDPDGSRTLGIITKPDDLPSNSESEKPFLSLARNEEKVVFFKLGWHVLKNRSFHERDYSFSQRNISEASFFNKGIWSKFPRDHVGIESLRTRLSVLLFNHIKNKLPEHRAELGKKLSETTKELGRLGTRRSTVDEQRHYLLKLSMLVYNTAKAALHGHYDAEYFGGKEDFEDAVARLKARRLRAMIQYMNKRFAAQLRREGPKYKFEGDDFFGIDNGNPELTDKSGGTSKSKGNASSESNMPSKPIVLGRRPSSEMGRKNADSNPRSGT